MTIGSQQLCHGGSRRSLETLGLPSASHSILSVYRPVGLEELRALRRHLPSMPDGSSIFQHRRSSERRRVQAAPNGLSPWFEISGAGAPSSFGGRVYFSGATAKPGRAASRRQVRDRAPLCARGFGRPTCGRGFSSARGLLASARAQSVSFNTHLPLHELRPLAPQLEACRSGVS